MTDHAREDPAGPADPVDPVDPVETGATGTGERDRDTRWRLVLGRAAGAELAGAGPGAAADVPLTADDRRRDDALEKLYDGAGSMRGSGTVSRWLGDIRGYFPSSVVQVMQSDAMTRLGLRQLLLEPEMLRAVQPDLSLVTTLVGLGRVIPEASRQTARAVVRRVTDELEERLRSATVQAVTGALDRATRTRRPRPADIDWRATIAANLRHWLPEQRTVVPERLIGHARRTTRIERRLVLCIDQSGSMARSVVYASVFGAVLASVRSLSVRLVAFDTSVVDLTEQLQDPVDVLFGIQLGGGTDIAGALTYCAGLVEQPDDTVLVLISDLYENGPPADLLARAGALVRAGVTVVALLALSDEGSPSYDAGVAESLAGLGVPAFACTPDLFPDLMAATIERRDLGDWAAQQGITTAAPVEP